MRIDPNKPQPKPKPVMSPTDQVMQVVKWGIVVVVAVNMFNPVVRMIAESNGWGGESISNELSTPEEREKAAGEAAVFWANREAQEKNAAALDAQKASMALDLEAARKQAYTDDAIDAPVESDYSESETIEPQQSQELGISTVGCGQATRIINNPPEMVEACAKVGITLRGEDPSDDHLMPLPEVFDANGFNDTVVVIYTENRLGKAAEDCKKIDRNNNTAQIVEYCDRFANGNTFGEPTE